MYVINVWKFFFIFNQRQHSDPYRGGGVCRGDTSWATPDGINMHKEVAPNGLSYYMLKPHLSQQITVNKCLVENTVGI